MQNVVIRSLRRGGTVLALGLAGAVGACAPALSTQQEVQLGRDQAQQINRQLPLVRDQATVRYINELGRSIARVADPRGIPYNFYVVNSDVVNAFAIPGGHIYINRGLIERADNAAELAGVLAHEIGHVVERHGVEQWQRAQNANLGLSVLYGVLLGREPGGVEQAGIGVVGSGVFAKYGRDAEREADREAVGYLVRSGYDPSGLPGFFEELMEVQRRQPGAVEQWFSTHPLTQERIANTREVIRQTPGAQSPQLIDDTRAFQNFRARVRQLPPAPRERR